MARLRKKVNAYFNTSQTQKVQLPLELLLQAFLLLVLDP